MHGLYKKNARQNERDFLGPEFEKTCHKLVSMVAGKFFKSVCRPDLSQKDFQSWGWEGIGEAKKKYDPSKAGFTIYAKWWVIYKIQQRYAEWCGYSRTSPKHIKDIIYSEFQDDSIHSISAPVEERYDCMELWDKVLSLPPQYSILLILRYQYEMKYIIMCYITGLSRREVRKNLDTAIKMLKDIYKVGRDDKNSP